MERWRKEYSASICRLQDVQNSQYTAERGELMRFLFVALGGAAGAVGRYAISLIPVKTEFPVLTLITNIIGAVLIGFVVGLVSAHDQMSPNKVLFWKTGVCGGFTTFSTFSLEAYTLFENHSFYLGGAYVICSVLGCIAGVVCGKKMAVWISL